MVDITVTVLAMIPILIIFSSCMYLISCGIVIDPHTSNQYASVRLGGSGIWNDSYWLLHHDNVSGNGVDWGAILTLSGSQYGFRSGVDGSSISIIMDGYKSGSDTDGFFAFSIADEEYLTFALDFDGLLYINDIGGLFIYPQCNSSNIINGNPSTLLPINGDGESLYQGIRNNLAGNDSKNWYLLTDSHNGDNTFPVTFTFTNNDNKDTFEFMFTSSSFSGINQLSCTFNSAVSTEKDFKFYVTTDYSTNANYEHIYIKSFTINGYVFVYDI